MYFLQNYSDIIKTMSDSPDHNISGLFSEEHVALPHA